jgi:hypothetical protein
MLKGLCWASLGIAGLLTLCFVLDMVLGMPFGGASVAMDVFGILAGGVIVYLAIDTIRELR